VEKKPVQKKLVAKKQSHLKLQTLIKAGGLAMNHNTKVLAA
jgi:hypothetical protein